MDGDDDDYADNPPGDNALVDNTIDDNLSVVSLEGDQAEASSGQTSTENNSNQAAQSDDRTNIVLESPSEEIDNNCINDHAHYRNMMWNDQTYRFEYTRDHDEAEDSIPNLNQWKKIHPRKMKKVNVTFNQGRNTMVKHYVAE
eukprot:scaffold739_cov66-Cyclotella_meneghiniana.AAC.4